MNKSLDQLVRKYEEMIGQEKSIYFDADQIEAIAFSFESKEDFKEALNVVNYGLQLHPANPSLLLCKAKYLLFLDYIDAAGELLPLLPDDSEEATLIHIEYQFAQGNFKLGFDRINQQMDSLSWEFALDVINILWSYVTYDEIISFILSSLKKLPDNPQLLGELAAIYQDNGEEDQAIRIYNQLLDRDPYQVEIWRELAKTYSLKKDYEKAIEACDFALAIQEGTPEILCLKGYCQYDMGNFAGALNSFKEYEATGDDLNRSYEYISDCYIKMEQIAEAIAYLNKALTLKPDNQYLLYQLAYCYQDMGNTPMAKEFLHKGLALNEEQLECHAMLGEILVQEDNYEEAFQAYHRALLLEPENVELLATLGDLCERLDQMENAVIYYEQAHEIKKYDIKILFRLLLGYYATNQSDKAATLSDEIIALTDQIESDSSGLTEEEKREIEDASAMVDTIKKLLQEIIENKN
ncbi:MAG: tetratricopeptide repeat protein [Bacteroidales bacterium]